jgi:ubiquinone/menaquinone biosynthesis C-methylase UbiE
MSRWTEEWRDFVKESSYKSVLKEKGWSDDQFWNGYPVYDEILSYINYPGDILGRIDSLIAPGCTFLDIGAGTGAFSIPLAKRAKRMIALDPSRSQLDRLQHKAAAEGIGNIEIVNASWEETAPEDLGEIDYTLSAYSLFAEDVEEFLQKMFEISRKGAFIVFRAGQVDPLSEFAYGPRASADHLCLQHILEDIGHDFEVEIFERDYALPLRLVFQQYRFSDRTPNELTEFLRGEDRLIMRETDLFAAFRSDDALLYHLS